MLNVLRFAVFGVVVDDGAVIEEDVEVTGDEELQDILFGEIRNDDEESFEIGDALTLLGERIRLVNEPSFAELICAGGEGGIGKGGDDDGFVFNCSSMLVEGTVVSNLSSLIRRDSNLEVYIARERSVQG